MQVCRGFSGKFLGCRPIEHTISILNMKTLKSSEKYLQTNFAQLNNLIKTPDISSD